MTRFRILYKEEAITDLEAIRDYIAQDSPRNSDAVIAELVATIRSLEFLPTRNRVRQSRKIPGLSVYGVSVLSYLIYYRVNETEQVVRILTVRHGARRQPKRFA